MITKILGRLRSPWVGGTAAAAVHYFLFWACFLLGFSLGMSDFDEGPTAWGTLGRLLFWLSQLLSVPIASIALHSSSRDIPSWQQHAIFGANSFVWGIAAALALWLLRRSTHAPVVHGAQGSPKTGQPDS
jgi:hypothetical protein